MSAKTILLSMVLILKCFLVQSMSHIICFLLQSPHTCHNNTVECYVFLKSARAKRKLSTFKYNKKFNKIRHVTSDESEQNSIFIRPKMHKLCMCGMGLEICMYIY